MHWCWTADPSLCFVSSNAYLTVFTSFLSSWKCLTVFEAHLSLSHLSFLYLHLLFSFCLLSLLLLSLSLPHAPPVFVDTALGQSCGLMVTWQCGVFCIVRQLPTLPPEVLAVLSWMNEHGVWQCQIKNLCSFLSSVRPCRTCCAQAFKFFSVCLFVFLRFVYFCYVII